MNPSKEFLTDLSNSLLIQFLLIVAVVAAVVVLNLPVRL
jgi:hypothetical protein